MGHARRAAVDVQLHVQIDPTEVRAHLERLLASHAFSSSPRRAQLLRYLVGRALAGKGEQINEYAIGVDAFGKPPSFDPRLDSIVRTELSRLRQKLKEYYAEDGLRERIQIELPPRSYAPKFRLREQMREAAPQPGVQHHPRWWLRAGAIAAADGIAALAISAVAIWALRSTGAHPMNSVAVLPFVNLSPDHRDDYLADGITEELTNDLAQSAGLRVVARTSAWLFKGRAADIREIGRKLNVADALEGSFEREGDRVRITAQLNRTSDGYHVWSRSYQGQDRDMMAIEHQIAQSITGALGGRVVRTTAVVTADSTQDPAAHDLYLRAYELGLHHPGSYRQSLALFDQAIHADRSYVNAYIGIARVHIQLVHLTQEAPQQGFAAAKAVLEKALALDPACGEARGLLADLIAIDEWNWPLAEQEFRRALEQGAQSTTHSLYGSLLATRGRFREAQAELRTAQDLDPLAMGPRFNQVQAFYMQRDYAEAVRIVRGMLEMNPDQWDARFTLAGLDIYQHNCEDAGRQYEWCARKFSAPVTKIGLALASACAGKREQALSYLDQAKRPDPTGYTSPFQLAIGYSAIGDKEAAISLLEKSADIKEMQVLVIKYDPVFDGIRGDARFIALEKRVGLLN